MILEVFVTALATALACSLPGVYLVVRRSSLMADAITHSVLPGIVIGYLLEGGLGGLGPYLGALASALVAVILVELLVQSRRIKYDASIGLVFPVLFATGILLVSLHAANVHLDIDAVLMGELAWVPLERISLGPLDLPRALVGVLAVLLLALTLLLAFTKELLLSSFDPDYARCTGIPARVYHYGIMVMTALTAVAAFEAVGSVLMVAYIAAPAATSRLLSRRLPTVHFLSAGIASLATVMGFALAWATDTNIAAAIAVVLCLAFLLVFGLTALARRAAPGLSTPRLEKELGLLAVHLCHHRGSPDEERECALSTLSQHLGWSESETLSTVELARQRRLVTLEGEVLRLTPEGLDFARRFQSLPSLETPPLKRPVSPPQRPGE